MVGLSLYATMLDKPNIRQTTKIKDIMRRTNPGNEIGDWQDMATGGPRDCNQMAT